MQTKWLPAAMLILNLSAAAAPVEYGKMYWPNRGSLQRANLDGSEFQTLINNDIGFASGIDIDVSAGLIYLATDHGIDRCKLDGTHRITYPMVEDPYTVRLDLPNRQLYWADRGNGLYRMNMDGTGNTLLFSTPGVSIWAVDLDPVHNKVYWTTGYSGMLYRANLDGTQRELLVSGIDDITRVRLDVAGGKMYWSSDLTVKRADLDGSNVETLVTGLRNAIGIALDLGQRKLYWTDNALYQIGRANFDGSQREVLVQLHAPPAAPNPLDIAIIPVPEPMAAVALIGVGVFVFRSRRNY